MEPCRAALARRRSPTGSHFGILLRGGLDGSTRGDEIEFNEGTRELCTAQELGRPELVSGWKEGKISRER